MATFEVGIAVNTTVRIEVEADNEAGAEQAGAAKFWASFEDYITRIDRKSCYVETVDIVDED